MKNFLERFGRDEGGATAIEYGLLAALIAVALIVSVSGITPKIAAIFSSAANAIPQS